MNERVVPRFFSDLHVTGRRAVKLGWGLIDQAASSATSLLLTIAAARVLGAASLGVIVIGFTAYLVLLGLERALISAPLVVSTAAESAEEREIGLRCAVTMTLLAGVVLSALMIVAGLATGGAAGRALLLFAPWMPFALLQELWRSALFRDARGGAAAANDVLWLAAMSLILIAAWSVSRDWAIVSSWGLGAALGAAAGFAQLRVRVLGFRKAWTRWRRDFWPLGRWFFGGSIAYSVGSQVTVLLIAALLGSAALGGLRAVQTVFAPLTLLFPALALPALPTMSRRLSVGAEEGRHFALQVSGLLIVLTTAYVVLVGVAGGSLLGAIFGHSFKAYDSLILPIAFQQIAGAGSGGFSLLLQAQKRAKAIFAINVAFVPLTIALIVIASAAGGLVAVAWSMAAVAAVSLVATAVLAMWRGASTSRAPQRIESKTHSTSGLAAASDQAAGGIERRAQRVFGSE